MNLDDISGFTKDVIGTPLPMCHPAPALDFDYQAVCSKCGWDDVRVAFCAAGGLLSLNCVIGRLEGEALARQCKRCGYGWLERTTQA